MSAVPPRVAVPFLLAGFGVLLMIGLVLDAVAGHYAVLAYVLILIGALLAGGLAARRRTARITAGHSCTCCTSTVHDPVQVI